MDEIKKLSYDLVHLSRLALTGTRQDVELFVRRINRRLEKLNVSASKELSQILENLPRRGFALKSANVSGIPVDSESRQGLLKFDEEREPVKKPILSEKLSKELEDIISEQSQFSKLLKAGVEPSKTIIFVGPPGVGKTYTAKYIANKLELPLLTVDLSTVMSSYLGKTGSNLRNIFDYAKSSKCILFLDEIDALAKKRDDTAEVGELKRLVTVLLQEIDSWPNGSLLIAATNHQDLLDPAVWRRFDQVLTFERPAQDVVQQLVNAELSTYVRNKSLLNMLSIVLNQMPQAEIIREVNRIRRSSILNDKEIENSIQSYIEETVESLEHDSRIQIAKSLTEEGFTSQRKASALTGVSRDTIRSTNRKKEKSISSEG